MKTNVSNKANELTLILNTHFQGQLNKARVKLIALFVIALCKVQTVNFEKLANAFDTKTLAASSVRRIQRFIASFGLDADLIAQLVFNLLPKQEKLGLTIDRTNWKFGQLDINIFMLGVVYHGVAFPLMFSMLAKRGNSNSQERIDLIDRFIRLFGKETIGFITADREFVGGKWIAYLNQYKIPYYLRIRNNFKVFLPHKNKLLKVSWLFNSAKVKQFIHYNKIVEINGQLCYLSGCRLTNKNGQRDYLIIISYSKPEKAQQIYAVRWQIEMCFKAMKKSGFNLEETHLNKIERIEKLVLLVMIAFVWCYKAGIYRHEQNPIKIKKHGRKAQSIFKYGLGYIASYLLNTENQITIEIFEFLSCT